MLVFFYLQCLIFVYVLILMMYKSPDRGNSDIYIIYSSINHRKAYQLIYNSSYYVRLLSRKRQK